MALVVWGLLALCGGIGLMLAVVLMIEPGADLEFGVLDVFVIVLCLSAIATFVVRLRRFRGRGPDAGLLYWCGDCAHEWFVADQAAAPISLPPEAPSVASTQVTTGASEAAPGIPRIMEALKEMPLPEKVKGWNQVISVEITDRPDLRYGWVIDGDRWHVTTGQTMRCTLRLVATEANLMDRLATGSGVHGYSLEGPVGSFGGAGVKGPLKCLHLMDGMAAYLRASHQPALQEWLSQRSRTTHDLDAMPSEVRLAVEYLTRHLRQKDVRKNPAEVQSLVNALVELGPPAVADIHAQLGQSANRSCAGDLVEAINRICSGPGPVVPRIKLLAYGGEGLAHRAFRPGQVGLKTALVAAGPAVVDPLIASLHDENVNVRQGAAEVLGRIGDPRASASLAELANDPDSNVRKTAAQAQAGL